MHILYVDDSGDVGNALEAHFVLGGISVFERGLFHQITAADQCVEAFQLGPAEDIELHGSPMYNGRDGVWRAVRNRAQREQMINAALATVTSAASVRMFAVAVDKAAVSPEDPVKLAFEELCNRFNLFLERINNRTRRSRTAV